MHYPSLFSPLKIGPYQLKHRLVMAPLTRMRAEKPSLAPRPLNTEYYAQRATSGGLIIAEAPAFPASIRSIRSRAGARSSMPFTPRAA